MLLLFLLQYSQLQPRQKRSGRAKLRKKNRTAVGEERVGDPAHAPLALLALLPRGHPRSRIVMSSSDGDASEQSRRLSVLSWDQVQRLDSILGESVPIHGRGNFPTLSVQPRQIVQVRGPPSPVTGVCLDKHDSTSIMELQRLSVKLYLTYSEG